MLADALITCGSWMANYKVQQGRVVLDSYLRPGEKLAAVLHENEKSKENAQRATLASLALAQLVANLFEALSTRLQSLEWRKGRAAVEASERELQRCELLKDDAERRSQVVKNRKASEKAHAEYVELSIYIQTLKKETDAKKIERADIESSADTYLNLAVQSFATALSLADTGNGTDMSRHVCRMVSLWFLSYRDKRSDNNINALVADHIEQIPTFRFVPLANQLLSRLENLTTSDDERFQSTLQRLIFKMCADHPYHCLVQLIALSNGKKVGSGVGGRNASAFLENVGDSKIVAAKAVIRTLKKEAPKFIGDLLESYRMLTDAYIFLANAPTVQIQKTKTKNIPYTMVCSSQKDSLDQCLGRSRNRVDCPPCVLTAPPPLRPGCDYGDGVEDPIGGERIAGFEPTFNVAESGIHRPKIVMCLGSNGGRFRQLAKGEDEIRQDAVMSQVFTYVNELMLRRAGSAGNMSSPSEGNRRAARLVRHKLRMVTYNIVPLSPASGVSPFFALAAAIVLIIIFSHRNAPTCRYLNGWKTPWASEIT
jgi:ataxia telangiectasia mutated family protein